MPSLLSAPSAAPAPAQGTDRRDTPANRTRAVTRFESLVIAEMLAAMRKAKLGEGLFETSREDEWRKLADRVLAENLAARSPLGLGDAIAGTAPNAGDAA